MSVSSTRHHSCLYTAKIHAEAHSMTLYILGSLTQSSGYPATMQHTTPPVPPLVVSQALHLKHRDEVKGPFPTAEEPSDHVVLAAGYKFNRPTTD